MKNDHRTPNRGGSIFFSNPKSELYNHLIFLSNRTIFTFYFIGLSSIFQILSYLGHLLETSRFFTTWNKVA
jgi:hypothetical protein